MEVFEKKYGEIKPLRLNYFELGRTLVEHGKYGRAENAFMTALKEKDDNPLTWELYFYLGKTLEKQDKKEEAIKAYLEGIISSPNVATFLFDRIDEIVTRNNISGTLPEWIEAKNSKFLSSDLQDSFVNQIYLLLGNLHLKLHNLEKATNYLESIPNSAPGPIRMKVLKSLANIYYLTGNFSNARDTIEVALANYEESKTDPIILVQYVDILLALKNYQDARRYLMDITLLTENKVSDSHLLVKVAKQFMHLGEWETALQFVQRIDPEQMNEASYRTKLEILVSLHHYEEALETANTALQIYPLDNVIFLKKIQALIEGQLGIHEGVELFTDSFLPDANIAEFKKTLSAMLEARYEDSNAHYFYAMVLTLIPGDKTPLEASLNKIRKEGTKIPAYGGINNGYPTKVIDVLEGYWQLSKAQAGVAADHFLEAGRKYYWEGLYETAVSYLEKAIELNPELHSPYWYLADSLRIISRINTPPYNDAAILEQAYQAWEKQTGFGMIKNSNEYWSYLVGSRIHDLRYSFVNENFLAEQWKATLYAERAIVHQKDKYLAWTDLGKCYTNMGMYHTGYRAFQKALALNDQEIYVLEEYSKVLLNLYRFKEAGEYLDKIEGDYKYLSWKGFMDYIDGNYNGAISLFNEHNSLYPNDVWPYRIKMGCYWLSSRPEEARSVARKILSFQGNKAILRQEEAFSKAAFIDGNVKKAIQIAEKTCNISGDPYHLSSNLCLYYLVENQLDKAEKQFNHALAMEQRPKALEIFILELEAISNLPVIDKGENQESDGEIVKEKKANWITRLRNKITSLEDVETHVKDELHDALELGRYKQGTLPWIALHAGLARILWEEGDFAEAYTLYQNLRDFDQKFPDAAIALEALLTGYIRTSHTRLSEGKYEELLHDLESLKMDLPELMALQVKAYLGLNKLDKSQKLLAKFLKETDSKKEVQKRQRFVDTLFDLVPNVSMLWSLYDLLHPYENQLESITYAGSIGLKAILENCLAGFMNKDDQLKKVPALSPLVIEVSPDLAPIVPDSEWLMLQEYIPHLRTEMLEAYGIRLPGIRIRQNDYLPPSNYTIFLNEAPMSSGMVKQEMLFVPESMDLILKHEIAYEPGEHPLKGTKAAWVGYHSKNILEDLQIPYWEDPYSYIIAHIQLVVQRKLDYFFDMQYSYDYLQDAEKDLQRFSEDSRKIYSNPERLRDFNKVLKALLLEGVPVIDKEKIIRNFHALDMMTGTLQDNIMAIRENLKEYLPGNLGHSNRLALPQEVEQLIANNLPASKESVYLALEPKICQEVLLKIKEIINGHNTRESALVVNDPKLRFVVGRIASLEFLDIKVIAKDEILAEEINLKQ